MKKLIILLIIIGIGLVLIFGGKLLKNTGLTNEDIVSKGFDWVTGKGTDEGVPPNSAQKWNRSPNK